MKIHSVIALALSLSTLPVAAHAADEAPTAAAATIKSGDLLWSSDGRRIGRVDRVRGASVSVIYDTRMIYVPAATLKSGDKGLTTSLTRKEIDRL